MILRVIVLFNCLIYSSAGSLRSESTKCMTSYMTDVLSWVDENGVLYPSKVDIENTIDLSASTNPVPQLQQKMMTVRSQKNYIKYLSLARCGLSRVPPIFQLRDTRGRCLYETLEYMSFFGNNFVSVSNAGKQYAMNFNATGASEINAVDNLLTHMTPVWSSGFTSMNFSKLRELDLRVCSIQILGTQLFSGMPNLTALYIGGNEIYYIDSTAFLRLNKLKHLDLSKNQGSDSNGNPKNLATDNYYVFENLKSLESLDLSYTRLTRRNLGMLTRLGKSLKNLSLCETGLTRLQGGLFNTTSLQFLDLSRNSGILNLGNALRGIEETLLFLYAKEVNLQSMDMFANFTQLEILNLSFNEISDVKADVVKTLTRLQILDLNKNRITSWFDPTYSTVPRLKFLSLQNNNINLITEEMIGDLMNINYIALSGNFLVCNCHAKDFYKIAAINEKLYNDTLIKAAKDHRDHIGYANYNEMIKKRQRVELHDCDERCYEDINKTGKFRLIDYNTGGYVCLLVPKSRSVSIADVTSCSLAARELDYDNELAAGRNKLLALLTIPCVLLPVAMLFVFRRHVRYFYITLRNSAMLSLINKNETIDDDKIFNYDVFVSYCNEDRGWVLDHLLPHIEAECNVSACLHERDFQVGLSILENIVSCMDRSKSIMLIISQRFLLSQWCQFEMHLAQHRLLETRREDLTLVLLEDIPRRLRPNTLHYLMLTKTYIVWPKEESERNLFWRRLNKTLVTPKIKQIENVSLA